jgi:hypothetical protein
VAAPPSTNRTPSAIEAIDAALRMDMEPSGLRCPAT